MVVSRRVAWFLLAFGVWSWIIWPTFLKNIWHDPRSWQHGMTAFFGVHLVLTVVSLVLGTVIGALGVRGLLADRRRALAPPNADPAPAPAERCRQERLVERNDPVKTSGVRRTGLFRLWIS